MEREEKDVLIRNIDNMYKHIGNQCLNYWGVAYGDQLAPLGCLYCAKCIYDYKTFSEYGPSLGKHVHFCDSCSVLWRKNVFLLITHPDFNEEDFKKATYRIRKYKNDLRNSYSNCITNSKTKPWVML